MAPTLCWPKLNLGPPPNPPTPRTPLPSWEAAAPLPTPPSRLVAPLPAHLRPTGDSETLLSVCPRLPLSGHDCTEHSGRRLHGSAPTVPPLWPTNPSSSFRTKFKVASWALRALGLGCPGRYLPGLLTACAVEERGHLSPCAAGHRRTQTGAAGRGRARSVGWTRARAGGWGRGSEVPGSSPVRGSVCLLLPPPASSSPLAPSCLPHCPPAPLALPLYSGLTPTGAPLCLSARTSDSRSPGHATPTEPCHTAWGRALPCMSHGGSLVVAQPPLPSPELPDGATDLCPWGPALW